MKRCLFLTFLLAVVTGGWLWHHRNVFPEGHRDKYPAIVYGDQDGKLEVTIGMDVRNGIRSKKLTGFGTVLRRKIEVRIVETEDENFTLLWTGVYQFTGQKERALNQLMTIPYNSGHVSMDIGESLRIGVRMEPYN